MEKKPKISKLSYDLDWFIDQAKYECEHNLKYDVMNIECAYGNLIQIYNTIISCVREHSYHFTEAIDGYVIDTRSSKSISHMSISSGPALIKLLHLNELYHMTVAKFPKYEDNYYPAIHLIEVLTKAGDKLLDNHSEIWCVEFMSNYQDYTGTKHSVIQFTISRFDTDPNLYNHVLRIEDIW